MKSERLDAIVREGSFFFSLILLNGRGSPASLNPETVPGRDKLPTERLNAVV
jgi:hypothetical protein